MDFEDGMMLSRVSLTVCRDLADAGSVGVRIVIIGQESRA
jgi:hypothetical protein